MKYRRKILKKVFWKLIAVIFIVVAFFAGYYSKKEFVFPDIRFLPELSTLGFVEMKPKAFVEAGRGIIVIENKCWQLIAYTEVEQAISIAKGIEKKIDFRPLTHDLIKSAFDFLEIKVLMVKIVDVVNNTFIARTILQQFDKVLSLDSRPSDGIAIAVRYDAPIYIKESLLKEYGKYIC